MTRILVWILLVVISLLLWMGLFELVAWGWRVAGVEAVAVALGVGLIGVGAFWLGESFPYRRVR